MGMEGEGGYITHVDLYSGGQIVEKFVVDKCPVISGDTVRLNNIKEHWRLDQLSSNKMERLSTHKDNKHAIISGTYVIWFEGKLS